jgi:pseudouridine synthase
VITNDGQLAHRLSHPRFEIDKEYLVTVEGDLASEDVKRLERGIDLDGKKTAPCEIKTVKRTGKLCVFRMKLHEGRKRQVRRMFEEAGCRVTDLKRVRYAGLRLGDLEAGQYRDLTEKEIKRLKGLAGETVSRGGQGFDLSNPTSDNGMTI